jgi:hypothetical protein
MGSEADRTAALLDRRTTVLATRPPRAGTLVEQARRSLIIWSLGDSLYGIEVAAVAAVIPFAGCARVPTREAACLGVIGRAGRFYSVIGLCRLLGAPVAETPPLHLLLLRGAAPYLALAVDRVLGRFDLLADGAAPELDGRLVALFDPAERLAALRQSPRDGPS